jgi:Anti-sigma factor NepR
MVDDKKKVNKAPIVNEKNERMIKTSAKPQVSDLIGQRLRNYYEEVANEPIPDRFMDLLNQLDAAGSAKKPK